MKWHLDICLHLHQIHLLIRLLKTLQAMSLFTQPQNHKKENPNKNPMLELREEPKCWSTESCSHIYSVLPSRKREMCVPHLSELSPGGYKLWSHLQVQ